VGIKWTGEEERWKQRTMRKRMMKMKMRGSCSWCSMRGLRMKKIVRRKRRRRVDVRRWFKVGLRLSPSQ
jgi:hypothetical protein